MYDPRACGAKCDVCPLSSRGAPVPPEANVDPLTFLGDLSSNPMQNPPIAIVGDAPGDAEEKHGKPFVGPAGMELDTALRQAGLRRSMLHLTHTILCKPPGNDLRALLSKISSQNKTALKKYHKERLESEKKGTPPPPEPVLTPTPIECCAPRLERELRPFRKFITLGRTATQAVTGDGSSIMAIRGAIKDIPATERTDPKMVMPTVSPMYVLQNPKYGHVFRNDIVKAGRWFRGQANWTPPEMVMHPTPAELRAFLSDPSRIYVYDLETDGIEPMRANIRCVGIGTGNKVMLVGLLGKDGHRKFYSPEAEREVIEIMKEFFLDPTRVKAGHNSLGYDETVLRSRWGIRVNSHIDTILLHKNVESELPHSLAYVVSLYAEAPAWKQDREGNKLSTAAETDEALHEYCCLDVSLTETILPKLADSVRLRDQLDVWKLDQRVQQVCADMHIAGMYVDQGIRLQKEKEALERRYRLLREIRERLGRPDFNPGSTYHMRDLLYDTWKLEESLEESLEEDDLITGSGAWSTADLVLRTLLMSPVVPKDQREIIKLIRYYRKVQKVLGTYITKLRPWNVRVDDDLGWDDDEEWIDKETRKRYGLDKTGIVDPYTGRMHPGYSIVVPVTGRLSSSKPMNAQNFPKVLRSMVTAAPGHVLVGADMDQVEFRVAAARWGVDLYLRAFNEGKDAHSMTAFAVFGEAFCAAAGIDPEQFRRPGPLVGASYVNGKFEGTGEDYRMRSLAKGVQFASQYMAKVETVHKMVCKTEIPSKNNDGTTDLPFALMPLRKVREMHENWLKGAPEYKKGWDREINLYRKQGYIREPVTGRRRDFLDGEAPNEIVNFAIQCVPGNVRVITKDGYIPIRELQGRQFIAWTGLRWAPATCISKGTAQLREVRANHGLTLVCDATHKFKVPDRSDYVWKEADSLIENQRVAIDLARPLEFGTPIDSLDAYVLGLYISDGCLVRRNKGRERGVALYFAVGKNAKSGREDRCGQQALERLKTWGISRGLRYLVQEEAGHYNVQFFDNIQYWVDTWGLNPGLKARDKRIPEVVWRSNLEARKNFLLGVLDGDGYQVPQDAVTLNMCNPDLLEEIAILCRTVGIDASAMHGPYKTSSDQETVSYRLSLSGAHVHTVLGWGRECKYRSNNTLPQFECARIVHRLTPVTSSHKTLKSRIKGHQGAGSMTSYMAVEMGVADVYDHAVVSSVVKLGLETEVFTLCVEDPDHQYVANGFISKNSSAAGLMNRAILQIHEQIPLYKWGPGTGIINQCHDAIVIECPEDKAESVAKIMEEAMCQTHPDLPGVKFTAKATIGKDWKKVG